MRKVSVAILLCLFVFKGYSQKLVHEFKGKSIVTDQFGYFYEISDTEIKKYSSDGKLYRDYSNNVLGVIANVDVTNPYKILVYFRDFTKIQILDNFLAPSTEVIDLTSIELDETTLVCRSYNDGTWYYNPVRFELIRKNQELATTNTSGNLANLLGKNIQPNYLVEYNNKVYLGDTLNGIMVFDMYGTYLKTIPLYGINNFQVKDKYLIYSNKDNHIETYDFFSLETKTYKPIKFNNIKAVEVQSNSIYTVNSDNLLVIDKIEE